jgi:hypothetical protein
MILSSFEFEAARMMLWASPAARLERCGMGIVAIPVEGKRDSGAEVEELAD